MLKPTLQVVCLSQGPNVLATSSFNGCVGDVEMDGTPIGLFNFQSLVEDDGCHGCSPVLAAFTCSNNVY